MFFEKLIQVLSSSELMGYVWQGFGHTLLITLIASVIGLFLGFVVALIKIAAEQNKWMKIPAFFCNIYTSVFRGTPVALQLFIFCLGIFTIPGFTPYAAILAFGFNSGAYVSESIRAGISSVDKGQLEAGRALGMSWTRTMIKIIMPQAVKNIIPAIGNELIALLKETSIIGMVGATVGQLEFDLTSASNEIFIQTSDFLVGGILCGCLYLLTVYVIIFIIKLIERKLKASDKR